MLLRKCMQRENTVLQTDQSSLALKRNKELIIYILAFDFFHSMHLLKRVYLIFTEVKT